MVVVVVGVCVRMRCLEERDRYLEQVSDTAGNLHSALAVGKKQSPWVLLISKQFLSLGMYAWAGVQG